MKFQVNFKTPDALHCALKDIEDDPYNPEMREQCVFEMTQVAEQYIEYGECLTVEFDTDAGTATVLKVKK